MTEEELGRQRTMRRHSYRRILLAVAGAMMIGAWLTVSGCGNGGDPDATQPQAGSGPSAAKVEAAMLRRAASNAKGSEAEVRKAFAVMETAPEPMPPHLRSRAQKTIGGDTHLGLRFDLAQRPKTPIGHLWVVGGSKGVICLFMEDAASSSCGPASDAIEFGKVLEIYRQTSPHGRMHDFRMVGIAPDWTRAVRIRTGKKELTIRVTDNTFGHRAEGPIRIVDLVR